MTWQEVLAYIDKCLEELETMMNEHPEYGVAIQQRMAVMMFKRQEVLARIGGSDNAS